MKVALINTSESVGGAAIACQRLFHAHRDSSNDVDCKYLVFEKSISKESRVVDVSKSSIIPKLNDLNHHLEKLFFLPFEASESVRFAFSTASFGMDISQITEIVEADILHLHWINKGFLSLRALESLFKLGKPIVWTLHDMWPFTGGCHYAGACTYYENQCGNCFFLKNPYKNDLSKKIWLKKKRIYKNANLSIVTCSKWLKGIANTSSLFENVEIQHIPNPIDVDLFYSAKSTPEKNSHTLLFQAMNLKDERKGFEFFFKSLKHLRLKYPNLARKIKLIFFGKQKVSEIDQLGFPKTHLGVLKEQKQIASAYRKADLFIIPSLQDNLPNTVMESLSCGIPVVGFDTGGIPEMVDHLHNGYIVPQKDSKGLAEGIKWVLENENRYKKLCANARAKAEKSYSYKVISNKYRELYLSLIKNISK